MAVAKRGAGAIVVAAESGAIVTIGVIRVQLRRLFLETLGLGSLPFGLGQARFSVLLGFSSAKLRFGTFAASSRLPLVRGSLGRLGSTQTSPSTTVPGATCSKAAAANSGKAAVKLRPRRDHSPTAPEGVFDKTRRQPSIFSS